MKAPSCLCLASPNPTPFIISVQEALLLDHSSGFEILRAHLRHTAGQKFCSEHEEYQDTEDAQSWIAARDILHALLAPVVALQDHASLVAQDTLPVLGSESLEYAFYGNGRNAFVWLQSFLHHESQWCLTTGCPTCVVTHAMDSESSIRLLVSACLLSAAASAQNQSVSRRQSVPSDPNSFKATLPSFEFFIRSIDQAMADDDLWGPEYFTQVEPKSIALQNAMQDLMYQCTTAGSSTITTTGSITSNQTLRCPRSNSLTSSNKVPSTPPRKQCLHLGNDVILEEPDLDREYDIIANDEIEIDEESEPDLINAPDSPDSIDSFLSKAPSVEGMPIKRSSFASRQALMLKEEAAWFRSVEEYRRSVSNSPISGLTHHAKLDLMEDVEEVCDGLSNFGSMGVDNLIKVVV